jgi:hypothetical protein
MVDSNAPSVATTVKKTSFHNLRAGEEYYGETILPGPEDYVAPDFIKMEALLKACGVPDPDIAKAIDQQKVDAEKEREEAEKKWQEQDERFAKAEEKDAKDSYAEQERLEADRRKKQQDLAAAWGSSRKMAELLQPDKGQMPNIEPVSVPDAVWSRLRDNKYFHLAHFLPKNMKLFQEANLDASADGPANWALEAQADGSMTLKALGKKVKVPRDLDLTVDEMCSARDWVIRALKQIEAADWLWKGWTTFFYYIRTHPARDGGLGEETVKHMLDIHRKKWYTLVPTKLYDPQVVEDGLEAKASEAARNAREVEREKRHAKHEADWAAMMSVSEPSIDGSETCSGILFFPFPPSFPIHTIRIQ